MRPSRLMASGPVYCLPIVRRERGNGLGKESRAEHDDRQRGNKELLHDALREGAGAIPRRSISGRYVRVVRGEVAFATSRLKDRRLAAAPSPGREFAPDQRRRG